MEGDVFFVARLCRLEGGTARIGSGLDKLCDACRRNAKNQKFLAHIKCPKKKERTVSFFFGLTALLLLPPDGFARDG